MAPRRRRVTPSQPSLPSGPTLRVRPREPAVAPEESFDLNDVPGSDDDDDDSASNPTDRSRNRVGATTAERADLGVNNPDLLAPKGKQAADIHYFYERRGEKMACLGCMYVFLYVHASSKF
jgi:hypothetical protein